MESSSIRGPIEHVDDQCTSAAKLHRTARRRAPELVLEWPELTSGDLGATSLVRVRGFDDRSAAGCRRQRRRPRRAEHSADGEQAHRAGIPAAARHDRFPRQFEAFAYLLRGDGNNVYVPRLPQHGLRGGNVGALAALTAAQLRAVADSVVTEASGLADSVVVVGLSMGGVIAAWIVEQRKVSRAVLIAPAIGAGRIPSLLQRPIIGLADRLPNVTRRTLPHTSRPDREMGFSSRAAAEILELGAEVLRQAESQPPQTMRVTMLLNANDRTVRESASEALAGAWAAHGAHVSIFELPDSLRLPHNVIEAYRGVSGGDTVLHLLRALAYGQPPTNLVRLIPLP